MTAVPGRHRATKAGMTGSRARAVARFFSAWGLVDCHPRKGGSNVLLTDKYAIRVEGMGKISKGRSAPGVLRELREEYPGRTPVLVRTVHPEVEKALVHVEADDFRKLLAWDEKEVRL